MKKDTKAATAKMETRIIGIPEGVTSAEWELGQKIFSWVRREGRDSVIITDWKKGTKGVPVAAMKIVVDIQKTPANIEVVETMGSCRYQPGYSWTAVEGEMSPFLQSLFLGAKVPIMTIEEHGALCKKKEQSERIFRWANAVQSPLIGMISDWRGAGFPCGAASIEKVELEGILTVRVAEVTGNSSWKPGLSWMAVEGMMPESVRKRFENRGIKLETAKELATRFNADLVVQVNGGRGLLFLKKTQSGRRKPLIKAVKVVGKCDYSANQCWVAAYSYLPEEFRRDVSRAGLL